MRENQKNARPRGTDSAKVIQVIVTEALEGSGTDGDPFKTQKRYWDFDGNLLFTWDPPYRSQELSGSGHEERR